MAETKGGSGHPPMDPKSADKLLELLSTDDSFRETFVTDPKAAFEAVGYSEPDNTSIACNSISNMASKAEFAAARQELQAHLVSAAAMTNPHCFEAGRIGDTLRRK